jgi:hypothetical protein
VGSGFVIISNRSGSSIVGTFNGKPNGAKSAVDVMLVQISYYGETENNLALTRAATPGVSGFVAAATGGQMQLQAQGYAGLSYVLEATPHLNPHIPWQPIGTNVANGSGLVQFVDLDMQQNAQRFYRIVSP